MLYPRLRRRLHSYAAPRLCSPNLRQELDHRLIHEIIRFLPLSRFHQLANFSLDQIALESAQMADV